jgi:hypothetical protein
MTTKTLPQGEKMKTKTTLNKVTVYLTTEEHDRLKTAADDEDVTLSAMLRAGLGLPYRRRGAPAGNLNRRKKAPAKPLSRSAK